MQPPPNSSTGVGTITLKIKITDKVLPISSTLQQTSDASDTSGQKQHPTASGPAEAQGPSGPGAAQIPESGQGQGEHGARPDNTAQQQAPRVLQENLLLDPTRVVYVGKAAVSTAILGASWEHQLSILQHQGTLKSNGVPYLSAHGSGKPEDNLTWLACGYDHSSQQYPRQRSESQLRFTRHMFHSTMQNFAQVPGGHHLRAV